MDEQHSMPCLLFFICDNRKVIGQNNQIENVSDSF